jgi:hypothetical protein
MKTLKLLMIGMALFAAGAGHTQVSINVNFPAPPMWGPVGYTEVNYYYLPDVEAFYDIQASMFIYSSNGVWVHRSYLPTRYRDYDLYGGYKVVMNDYHGKTPNTHFKEYKTRYAKGYRGHPQKTYGERPGNGNQGGNHHDDNHGNKGGGHEKNHDNGHGHDNGNSHGNGKNK